MVPDDTSMHVANVLPIQRYNRALGVWTRFDVGHMVTLQERDGGVLLVKDARVKDCIDLDRHLRQLTRSGSPNIMCIGDFFRGYGAARTKKPSNCRGENVWWIRD